LKKILLILRNNHLFDLKGKIKKILLLINFKKKILLLKKNHIYDLKRLKNYKNLDQTSLLLLLSLSSSSSSSSSSLLINLKNNIITIEEKS
jgi:hypothetical protein